MGSIAIWRNNLFSFPRYGNKTKRGIEFRHCTYNCLENLAKGGEQAVLIPGCFCKVKNVTLYSLTNCNDSVIEIYHRKKSLQIYTCS